MMTDGEMGRIGHDIARGGMAEIFDWDGDRVLKLYTKGCSRDDADRELAGARAACAAGIRVPVTHDLIRVGSQVGLIMERVDGPTMLEALCDSPGEMGPLACRMATLHADLHGNPAAGLPGLRQRLRAKIDGVGELAQETKAAILAALDGLLDGDALCHGDFHPGNVILTSTGPVIIDWFDAARGDPAADVARTVLLLQHAVVAGLWDPRAVSVVNSLRSAFGAAYLEHYVRLRPLAREPIGAWMLPVAAARLSEDVPDSERAVIMALVKSLVDRSAREPRNVS